jgi:parallel beta-helix repeat protein
MGKRNMVSKGIMASDKGIFLPNASEKFHYIPKNEVISVKMEKDLFGPYCLLNTVKGTVKLNQLAAENLISGGYSVGNAKGLGQIPLRGFKEVKKPKIKEDVPVPKKIGQGSLLLEESRESFNAKKKKLNFFSSILIAVGVVMAIIPLFLIQYFTGDLNVYLCFPWIFVLLGCTFVGLGAVMIRTARKAVPIRIYENGIVFSEAMRKDGGLFIPYGRIKTYTEVKIAIYGEVVQFHLEGATKYMIQKSMPGFLAVFEDIKDRIGKPEYDSEDFELISKKTGKKISIMMYGAILVLGFGFALMYAFISGYSNIQSLISQTLMFGSAFSLIVLPYMVYSMEFKKETVFKGRANPKMIAVMMVALLILFSIGWVTQVSEPRLITIYKDSPPETYAYSLGEISSTTQTLSDNIYVPSGSSLKIVNSTLTFATTFNKQYSIFVEEGGHLEIVNSSIRTDNILFGYAFEIHGSAKLVDSSFSRLYGSLDVNNGDGGLEIFSDDVLISNCSISHNKVNGLLIADSSPTIENCIISNNEDDGIEMQNADPVIRNCTISENGWAVIVNAKSNPHFEGNLFDSNTHGIDVYGSEAVIINNEFRNNENYAINVYDNSDATIENNIFEGNEEDVTSEMPFNMLYSMCSAIVVVIGLVATIVVISLLKSRRKKDVDEKKPE